MGCNCNGKYHYTNMISALATGQISYKDAMCEILKRLCDLENGEYSQVQANWIETDTSSPAYIKNKPSATDLQANWNESDTNAYGYIQNKPTIPPEQVQSDWAETNVTSKAFIQNKPAIPAEQVQANWVEKDQTKASFIQNKPGILSSEAETTPALVPPPNNTESWHNLHANGTWGATESSQITWNSISENQINNFSNIINQYQAYPTFGCSKGENLFTISSDPRTPENNWSIIQHWPYVIGFEKVNGHYWKFHITSYINYYTCTIPEDTLPFYNFGFNALKVFANSGLTWDIYKAAYNDNRTYSSLKYFCTKKDVAIDTNDVGLNAYYTNAGGYLGLSEKQGGSSTANALNMGRYFRNSSDDTIGSGLWPLQNFKKGAWFEADLWVWL